MNIAILGRTSLLLDTAEKLLELGNKIGLVWTSRAEAYYGVGEDGFRRLARAAGADFHSGGGLGRTENLQYLRSFGFDAAVSVNWPTRIPPAVFDCFRHGILNCHAGDLPRYRGNACPNWAILNGESHVGFCIHRMDEGLDTGPVICRDRFPLGDDTYIGEVQAWVRMRAADMFVEALEGLETGRLTPQPQPSDPTLSLRCYPRRLEDSRLHWDWPVEQLYRMVRASSRPFLGAFCFLENQTRVTVWRAAPDPGTGPFLAVPGQVCTSVENDPVIACGDGMLRLIDVELEMEPGGRIGGEEAKARICSSLRNRLT